MKLLISIITIFLGVSAVNAQTIDEELGFIYVKADYLLETDRYEDAIKEFTKIIAKDASYKDVLYKRGKAKYAIAAFKGTKNDLLQAFELVGITPESLQLFGKTQQNLDETEAASVTLKTASMLNGGSSTHKSGSDNDDSSQEEDSKGGKTLEDMISTVLDDILPDRNKDKSENETESDSDTGSSDTGSTSTERSDKDQNSDSSESTQGSSDRPSEIILKDKKEEVEPEEPEEDVSVNTIYIDEDLTLEIKNGLGARKIMDQPNILILSDASGNVSVDICVNENGKVSSAEFNKNDSSISTQSLVSLAVRKSKEFWFKKSNTDNMCGTIVFKITGN